MEMLLLSAVFWFFWLLLRQVLFILLFVLADSAFMVQKPIVHVYSHTGYVSLHIL